MPQKYTPDMPKRTHTDVAGDVPSEGTAQLRRRLQEADAGQLRSTERGLAAREQRVAHAERAMAAREQEVADAERALALSRDDVAAAVVVDEADDVVVCVGVRVCVCVCVCV